MTMIHTTADVSERATIGSGTRIWNSTQVRELACIGANCVIGKDVYIDFGVEIGDNCKIQNGALIYHGVTIEAGVFIGPGAIFTNDRLPRAINPDGSLKGNDDWVVGHTIVGYGASIGAGAVILPDVHIGAFALIGAGAVVTHDVPPHALFVGSPAKGIGYVCKCGRRMTEVKAHWFHCATCNEYYEFPIPEGAR